MLFENCSQFQPKASNIEVRLTDVMLIFLQAIVFEFLLPSEHSKSRPYLLLRCVFLHHRPSTFCLKVKIRSLNISRQDYLEGECDMLVVMMNDQLLPPTTICQSCLMADQQGRPRFHHGRLTCGRKLAAMQEGQPIQYECQMGFRIASVN